MDSPAEMCAQGKWNAVAPVSTCLGMLVEGVGSFHSNNTFKEIYLLNTFVYTLVN